jgi:hypothetical protein
MCTQTDVIPERLNLRDNAEHFSDLDISLNCLGSSSDAPKYKIVNLHIITVLIKARTVQTIEYTDIVF